MANGEDRDRIEDPRQHLESWATDEARSLWPEAEVRYRSRARKGSHCWQINAPGVGEFWLSATDDVLDDPREIDAATERLTEARWLERLPDVPGRGVQVKRGGRVFQWDPERDDTTGYLVE